ncbi:ATP-binding protein [Oceanispirochaeta sp.]|uniref:two-component system sensor histidine kinase NtrB n=1 Tax=Oceanispirochaeta sp. TaxID=2035350 RepID=UPI00263551D4|nr:ATP-binding protein [Oceanispirochaeta sp.]MDA3955644.1 PAS domain S-box protein [Oceanispirochaeta sp.]
MTDRQHEQNTSHPKLAENTLAHFLYTIEQSPQAVFWLNSNGQIGYVNDQACRSLGYSREELLSLYLWDIDPDFKQEQWKAHWEKIGRVTKSNFERRHLRKDGSIFPIEVTAYQVIHEGKGFHASFVNDITELVQSRWEQKKLVEQLHQAQKLEAIGTLAGGIAHDFNNMLSVILGYSELLKATISEESVSKEYLMQIENAALRSRDITQQLLAFSRKQVITPITLDINSQINKTLKMIGRLIGEQIDLRFDAQEDIWKINMDTSQLDQILINLAVNARDAMPEGGRLEISTSNVVLDGSSREQNKDYLPGQYVLLSFNDHGTGMDETTLSHIFEPFFTTKEQGKGTGLGLATIYGIMKQNDGMIDVQSEQGQGSTFNLYLPKAKYEEELNHTAAPVARSYGEGKNLLVE